MLHMASAMTAAALQDDSRQQQGTASKSKSTQRIMPNAASQTGGGVRQPKQLGCQPINASQCGTHCMLFVAEICSATRLKFSSAVSLNEGACRCCLTCISCLLLLYSVCRALQTTSCAVDKLFGLMTPMVSQGSRDSPCARAVPNLTDCAADGTLQVREGCCSTACAGKMQQVRPLQHANACCACRGCTIVV